MNEMKYWIPSSTVKLADKMEEKVQALQLQMEINNYKVLETLLSIWKKYIMSVKKNVQRPLLIMYPVR